MSGNPEQASYFHVRKEDVHAGSARDENPPFASFDVVLRRDYEALAAELAAATKERDEALAALKDEMQWDMGGVPENEWKARAVAAEKRNGELERLIAIQAAWVRGERKEGVPIWEWESALAVCGRADTETPA